MVFKKITVLVGITLSVWWLFGGHRIPTQAATDWYVSTTGNDGNLCTTETQPCETIQAVLIQPEFADGDTIFVTTGTYTGTASPVLTFISNESAKLSGGWNADFSA